MLRSRFRIRPHLPRPLAPACDGWTGPVRHALTGRRTTVPADSRSVCASPAGNCPRESGRGLRLLSCAGCLGLKIGPLPRCERRKMVRRGRKRTIRLPALSGNDTAVRFPGGTGVHGRVESTAVIPRTARRSDCPMRPFPCGQDSVVKTVPYGGAPATGKRSFCMKGHCRSGSCAVVSASLRCVMPQRGSRRNPCPKAGSFLFCLRAGADRPQFAYFCSRISHEDGR